MSTWFRLYNEVLDDPKAQMLPPEIFKHWINLLCLACRNDGKGHKVPDVSFALRLAFHETERVLKLLKEKCFMECKNGLWRPQNWDKRQYKSDTSTERVKRFRQRSKSVAVTAPETEAETETDTERKEGDFSNLKVGPKKFLSVAGGRRQGRSAWSAQQKKEAWQGKISAYVLTRLSKESYASWLEAFMLDEPWAIKKANEYSLEMTTSAQRKHA